MDELTVERLREVLFYNPDTGVFTWRKSTNRRIKIGRVAGTPNPDGYLKIKIDNHLYISHRLAWFYMSGTWPKIDIDHINGVRHDNRLSNLREATRSENLRNRGEQANNTSGFKGVHWCRTAQRWKAAIKVFGKRTCLGSFDEPEEAYAAYCAAAAELHGNFANFRAARTALGTAVKDRGE